MFSDRIPEVPGAFVREIPKVTAGLFDIACAGDGKTMEEGMIRLGR
jgi:hypothetical protein